MKKQTPESALLRLVLDYLAAESIFAIRMNTGAVLTEGRFFRFGVPGMADILAFPKIKRRSGSDEYCIEPVLWMELKAPRGVQSELQKSFQSQVESEGHSYRIIRSIEDVMEALK